MTDAQVAQILDRFRAAGGRVTDARRQVVEALVAADGHHITAPQVLDAVRRQDPAFHESTVYRTLDRLAELGVVTVIEVAGGPAVYHLPTRAHHHLVCDRCGRVVGASPDLLRTVADRLRAEYGFELRAEAVTLPGRCVGCEVPTGPAPVPGLHHDHHDH